MTWWHDDMMTWWHDKEFKMTWFRAPKFETTTHWLTYLLTYLLTRVKSRDASASNPRHVRLLWKQLLLVFCSGICAATAQLHNRGKSALPIEIAAAWYYIPPASNQLRVMSQLSPFSPAASNWLKWMQEFVQKCRNGAGPRKWVQYADIWFPNQSIAHFWS